MKGAVKWVGDAMFVAESGSGHAVVVDGPPDGGGRNLGVRPMELVLLGMGACTAYDVVHILRKARQDVRGCRVELDAERAESPPQVFTKIHVHFIITGKGITPAQAERAVQLSAEKYCSASIMLGKTAAITHDFVVEEAV
ncbi:MAG: Protein YhfA [Gammaproteobacteria bacterium]|nr:Protein YhfA [Gammaproteobacteria bacterium]